MEKIEFIKTTDKFLNFNDYLEIYNELDDEKIKDIINNYKDLIKNSLITSIDNYKKNSIPILLETIRFWKDFFCLFYLALFFIKEYYKSNSIIISLGESPSKLVFIQSLFYNDDIIYKKLENKNYPINLNFKYAPLSKLSIILLKNANGDLLKPFSQILRIREWWSDEWNNIHFKYNYDNIIKLMDKNYNSTIECNFKNYILNTDLDPLKIINSDKNIIIIDRAESMSTLATLFYLYTKLNTFKKLTSEEKNIFFCKFSFIGFEFCYNNIDKINEITERINYAKSFIKNILQIDDLVLEKMIKIKLFRFDYCLNKELFIYKNEKNPLIFFRDNFMDLGSAHSALNLIGLISVPEKYNFLSRCIKSYSLENKLPNNLFTNFKQTDTNSVNCNFINFIIFLIFMKLKKTDEFDKLINNIDKIDVNSFSKDTKTDIPIDKFFESLNNEEKFINFFIDDSQIISKTIFNDKITFSYDETFNKDAASFKNKYLKYKNKYLKYKNKY
jgi:hypothetical protein